LPIVVVLLACGWLVPPCCHLTPVVVLLPLSSLSHHMVDWGWVLVLFPSPCHHSPCTSLPPYEQLLVEEGSGAMGIVMGAGGAGARSLTPFIIDRLHPQSILRAVACRHGGGCHVICGCQYDVVGIGEWGYTPGGSPIAAPAAIPYRCRSYPCPSLLSAISTPNPPASNCSQQ
jgi:hypothetical protein